MTHACFIIYRCAEKETSNCCESVVFLVSFISYLALKLLCRLFCDRCLPEVKVPVSLPNLVGCEHTWPRHLLPWTAAAAVAPLLTRHPHPRTKRRHSPPAHKPPRGSPPTSAKIVTAFHIKTQSLLNPLWAKPPPPSRHP